MSRSGNTPTGPDPSATSSAGLSWIEVSLQLDDELVEPASELLGRIASAGLVVEPFGGKLLLRAWLPDDAELDPRIEQLEHGLWHLSQIAHFPQPNYRRIADRDWQNAWKHEYRPLRIGGRLLVQPVVPKPAQAEAGTPAADPRSQGAGSDGGARSGSTGGSHSSAAQFPWNDAFELIGDDDPGPPDPDRVTIYLEPGMAFGTGTHPTTRACLELLEQRIKPGDVVLDLGCGSGVLAFAAARLGAQSVLALDIDSGAIELARSNLRHNELESVVHIKLGSLAGLPAEAEYSLIAANIHAAEIKRLLEQGLASRLTDQGRLILSGILEEQAAEIESAAVAHGLEIDQRHQLGDWTTLVLQTA